MPAKVGVKEMLEAGVHFGHQTRRWNPKMRQYIFTQRDGIHIIDLEQTLSQTQQAYKFIADTVALGNSVLFVGTKKQAKEIIEQQAQRAEQFYVSNRWLGGMLTNFKTIRASIDRLNTLESRRDKGEFEMLTKKEGLRLGREIDKLENSLGGIKKMNKLPGAVFIIDPGNEDIARKEANKLGIPVIALVDTNCDPDGIDYLIPANDDAIRSIQLFTTTLADACLEGNERRELALRERDERADKEKAREVKKAPVRERERKVGAKGKAWVGRREAEDVSKEEAEKFASAKAEKKEEKTDNAPEKKKEEEEK
jgi:small subunit ribosomal protein S2